MISRVRLLTLATFGLALSMLVQEDANAAPNLYSETSSTQAAARLTVVAPRAGLYQPGDSVLISWRKRTAGSDVHLMLYSATASGLRNRKLVEIQVPDSVSSKWSESRGAVRWRLPKSLKPGRYVIVVKSKLDIESSEAFGVRAAATEDAPEADAPKLGASALLAAAVVKKVDVQRRGDRGTAVLENAAGEVTYEWGSGKCPALGGGLPGALATMAAIGKVEIQPRVREVTQSGSVLQRCLDGLVVVSGMPGQSAGEAEGDSK